MTGSDFSSCLVKIQRAEEHFVVYSVERQTWIEREPYVLSREFDAKTGRHSVILNVVEPPPLDHWRLIAGDCVHNLRSALDHAVYAMAVRDSGKNPPPKANDIMFPTVWDSAKWPEAVDRRIKCLSAASQAKIERLQPYNRPYLDFLPLLGVIALLDNSDKHRMLNIAQSQLTRTNIRFHGRPNVAGFEYRHGRIEGRTHTIYSFITNPPDADVKYNCNPSFEIMLYLSRGQETYTGPLGHILEILIAEAKGVIQELIV